MEYYVCGLMFSPTGGSVVLIQKARPTWQAGRFNGVGGRVEENECPHEAMAREFREETGQVTRPVSWKPLAVLGSPRVQVHFFYQHSHQYRVLDRTTDEVPAVFPVAELPPLVDHLEWLIPYALDGGVAKPVVLQFEEPSR